MKLQVSPKDERVPRLLQLVRNAANAPSGKRRLALAVAAGASCHILFAAAILTMIYSMFNGLTNGIGAAPFPWAWAINILLIMQFPLIHSFLLTRRGNRWLAKLVPGAHGKTLGTTTYATIASLQLLALFWLWTPSGIVWWRAEGVAFYAVVAAYAGSWLLLIKALFDAGLELHSGALGWLSLLADKRPRFPDMPIFGLFRIIRQPIYLAFALTLWTVSTWTPDQLVLALLWTLYCVLAPILKERRLLAFYPRRFPRYQKIVPYMVPKLSRGKDSNG